MPGSPCEKQSKAKLHHVCPCRHCPRPSSGDESVSMPTSARSRFQTFHRNSDAETLVLCVQLENEMRKRRKSLEYSLSAPVRCAREYVRKVDQANLADVCNSKRTGIHEKVG